MGWSLYRELPTYRRHFDACDTVIRARTGHAPSALLYTGPGAERGEGLDRIIAFQLVTFAVEYAVAHALMDVGVRPTALVGHSLGEYVAATLAGVLTLDEAIELIAARSAVMETGTRPGAMLSAQLSEADALALLDRLFPARQTDTGDDHVIGLSLVNGPRSVVFGGAPLRIEAVRAALAERGTTHRLLATSGRASHTPLMRASAEALDARAARIDPRSPAIAMTLNATGGWLDPPATLPNGYWGRQLTRTIRFEASVRALLERAPELVFDTGPGQALGRIVEDIDDRVRCLPCMRHPRAADVDETAHLLGALAEAWCAGLDVDWRALEPAPDPRRITLPGYPFERVRCWPEAPRARALDALASPDDALYPLLGRPLRVSTLGPGDRLFESLIGPDRPRWIRDHGDPPLLPATGFVEIALAAGAATYGPPLSLRDVTFAAALSFAAGPRVVQTLLTRTDADHAVRISSRAPDGDDWTLHVTARLGPDRDAPAPLSAPAAAEALPVDAFYRACAARGYHFGPTFRLLSALHRGADGVCGSLAPPAPPTDPELLPPNLLDACTQITWSLVDEPADADPYLPVALDHLTLHRPARGPLFTARARLRAVDGAHRTTDVDLLDADGARVASLRGLTEKQVPRFVLGPLPRWVEWLRTVRWTPQPLPTGDARAPEPVVVLTDATGVGDALIERLEAEGWPCTAIPLPPTLADDPRAPVDALPALPPTARVVVHLWSLDAHRDLADTDPMAASRRACAPLPGLIRHLTADGERPPRLLLVTRGARALDKRCPRPDQAPLWGAAQVARIEHPDVLCLTVDLDPDAPPADAARALASELGASPRSPEPQVAWRRGQRHVARLVPAGVVPARGPTFEADATYLVTGGLGGIGFHVAQWMAARGARRLVLVGRSIDKPHLAAPLAALRAAGVELVCAVADVTDRDALARVVGDIPANRPLRGVMHAAGALDDGILTRLDWPRFAGVMRARIHGTWHLHALTRALPLDHFVLFSSDAAGLGSSGQANHAAGNAFLDTFAAWRRARGLPALSVAWGGWAAIGGATAPHVIAQVEREGMGLIQPDEGLAILASAMSADRPHVDATPIDWPRFLAARPPQILPFYNHFHRSSGDADPPGDRREPVDLAARVHAVVASLLRQPADAPLDPESSLFDLGIDSLGALVIKNELQSLLGVRLPTTLLYRHPTLNGLIAHLGGAC